VIFFDADALYVALDKRRIESEITWTRIAAETGCSQSLFTRLQGGHPPQAANLMRLLLWLHPDLISVLSPYINQAIRRATVGEHGPELRDLAAGTTVHPQPEATDG
jgi:hypothetical protein